jgi:hypothetical protein
MMFQSTGNDDASSDRCETWDPSRQIQWFLFYVKRRERERERERDKKREKNE